MKSILWGALLAWIVGIGLLAAGCGGSSGGALGAEDSVQGDGGNGGGGANDATVVLVDYDGGPDSLPPLLVAGDSGVGIVVDASDGAPQVLAISPTTATLAVTLGTTPSIPTQTFTATYGGAAVGAEFTINEGQIGTIGVSTGIFTPTATLGGTTTVTATFQGLTVTATVSVKITYVNDGDPNPPDSGTDAAGGYGGVGGAGEGPPASSTQIGVLNGTPTADPTISFLYPYDKTVFPQALLPPLLQWTYGSHSFDGIYIHITENYYEYKGYFAAPATPFQNHPVPQSAWNALAYSNAGEPVTVQLTFSQGTAAYGPISESWIFAQGELKGTIYYQSYGTKLVQNSSSSNVALGTNTTFGGATLAIKEGQTSPVLVAGTSSTDESGCRVCHSVSANGSILMTEHGNSYSTSSTYALTASDTQNVPANNNGGGLLAWPALYPDGTFLLSNSSSSGFSASSSAPSALYSTTDGTLINSTGLNGLKAMTPVFSPDGTHIAYNYFGGTIPDGGAGDQTSLAAMDFATATKTFSNARVLVTPTIGHAYWPSFLPTSDGLIFEVETVYNGRDLAGTRSKCDGSTPTDPCHSEGTHAQLWWVDLKTQTATPLNALNGIGPGGTSYLPPHPSYTGTEGDDTTLNYEPTVNPVPSGGYAWVVFTSRRLYGNVATINPYWSDPRWEDISTTPTTKKLWVAAIDLNPTPGTDPSHPAFYLPAQELLAGNARGFWVVDPCQADGTSCVTGDECCGGYCRSGADGGLTCTATQPSCAQEYEKCTTTADCCGGASVGIECIGGYCSEQAPPPPPPPPPPPK